MTLPMALTRAIFRCRLKRGCESIASVMISCMNDRQAPRWTYSTCSGCARPSPTCIMPTLSRYSQKSIRLGSEHNLLRYARRKTFRCWICGLSSVGISSIGPSKLVDLVVKARAVMSYCKSFLYTMLTTAGIRALTYFEPVMRAFISSVASCQYEWGGVKRCLKRKG